MKHVPTRRKGNGTQKPSSSDDQARSKLHQCRYCGITHEFIKVKCPAYGCKCHKCGKKNHFSSRCRGRPVHTVDQAADSSNEMLEYEQLKVMTLDPERVDLEQINSLEESKYPRQIYVTMEVEGREVRFQVDSSATCNITRKYARKRWNTYKVLSMYNGTTVVPLGKSNLKIKKIQKNGRKYKAEFVVLGEDCIPIFGSRAAQQMEFRTVRTDNLRSVHARTEESFPLNKRQLLEEFADVFEGTGKLEGKYHLMLDESKRPVVHPPRHIPIALKGKLNAELDKLTEAGTVASVDWPTPCVSRLVCVCGEIQ